MTRDCNAGEISVSVIIPVLNEAAAIGKTLDAVSKQSSDCELIIVDGGSKDSTCNIVHEYFDNSDKASSITRHQLITTAPARADQMNYGAELSQGDALIFLHADTILPKDAVQQVKDCLKKGKLWGRFNVRLQGKGIVLRTIEITMNLRSRFSGIVTGDQTLFVRRDVFNRAGGFPGIPLMEDIVISRKLKDFDWPTIIDARVLTSVRRWRKRGIVRIILSMWVLRFFFWLGVPPETLVKHYPNVR